MKSISRYRVLEKLGEGGMGVVYKGMDTQLKRPVALKLLPEELASDTRRQRFLREAIAASSLDHPNICTIHEVGTTDDGQMFIAMAYYEGEALDSALRAGAFPIDKALDLVTQAAEGLARAHDSGIIHRDVKPANLMLTRDGLLKILDFGLARSKDETVLTKTGELVGTIAYMSPEQVRGESIDERTDIWSLGVVAYEMLTGRRPFVGNVATTVNRIQTLTPEPVRGVRADVPTEVAAIVHRALAKQRDHRYRRIGEMIHDLNAVRGGSIRGSDVQATATMTGILSTPAAAPRLPAVAILPFKNLSGGEESEYFSDGLTDELIHALGSQKALRVVSRTSVFKLKDTEMSLSEVAHLLAVDALVEGSVRRSGSRVRIVARLVSGAEDRQLWSEKYERELEDVFAVQDEIAQAIANRLQITLVTPSSTNRRALYRGSIEAYELYLKGRYFFNRRVLDRSLACFEDALTKDPNFAPAHAGLANYYALLGTYGGADPETVWPRARKAVLRALDLDRNLAEAHIALAYLRTFEEWDWSGAASEFNKALELAPGMVDPHLSMAMHLFQTGRTDAAFDEIEIAKDLDPLSALVHSFEVACAVYAEQFQRAVDLSDRNLEVSGDAADLLMFRGVALQYLGRLDEALEVLERVHEVTGRGPMTMGFLGACYAEGGSEDRALDLLSELDVLGAEGYVPPTLRALILAALRRDDPALEALEQAAEVRDAALCYVKVLPGFRSLRGSSRFRALLERVGLADFA